MSFIKKNKLILLIIILIMLIPIFLYADDPLDAVTKQMSFSETLIKFFKDVLKPFTDIFTTNINNSTTNLKGLAKGLMYLLIMYELGKAYLEGNYKDLPVKVCTLSFKWIAIATFLGLIGSTTKYYFTIPADIISKATGTSGYDWSNTDPITATLRLIDAIYAPWNNASTFVSELFRTVADQLNSWNPIEVIMGLGNFFVAMGGLVLLVLGYIFITFGAFGFVVKTIELVVAIPITVLFLAGKVIGVGEQYFSVSMKYIIASMMDYAIVFLVANIFGRVFTTLTIDTMMSLIGGLFLCMIYAVCLKVAPKIGSGVLNGSPGVSMSDATKVFDIAGGAAAIAGGAVAVGAGAVGGAMAAKATGGSMLGGAMSGAKGAAGGAGGAMSKMKNGANKALG